MPVVYGRRRQPGDVYRRRALNKDSLPSQRLETRFCRVFCGIVVPRRFSFFTNGLCGARSGTHGQPIKRYTCSRGKKPRGNKTCVRYLYGRYFRVIAHCVSHKWRARQSFLTYAHLTYPSPFWQTVKRFCRAFSSAIVVRVGFGARFAVPTPLSLSQKPVCARRGAMKAATVNLKSNDLNSCARAFVLTYCRGMESTTTKRWTDGETYVFYFFGVYSAHARFQGITRPAATTGRIDGRRSVARTREIQTRREKRDGRTNGQTYGRTDVHTHT